MASNDETMKGKVSQAWIFRCYLCTKHRSVESTIGRVNRLMAEKWIRDEKWSKRKDGWTCPDHNKEILIHDDDHEDSVDLFTRLIHTHAASHGNQRPMVEDLQELLKNEGQHFTVREIKKYGREALENMIH